MKFMINIKVDYSKKDSNKNCGFTLIELLIVICVIGILAGISIPNFSSWKASSYVKSAARDLYSAMQEARMIAIKDNINTAIVFDSTNNRYYLCDDSGADGDWSGINDNIGTGDNQIVRTYDLQSYKAGVGFGHGTITGNNSVTGAAFPADDISYASNVLIINTQGIGTGGYAYIQNPDGSRVYAVGTQTSGLVRLLRWDGGGWQ